jgi:hypothetical protein
MGVSGCPARPRAPCQGLRFLRQQLPDILAKRTDVLAPRMIRIIEDLIGEWRGSRRTYRSCHN